MYVHTCRYPELWAKLNREVLEEAGLGVDGLFFMRSGSTLSPAYSTMHWLGGLFRILGVLRVWSYWGFLGHRLIGIIGITGIIEVIGVIQFIRFIRGIKFKVRLHLCLLWV